MLRIDTPELLDTPGQPVALVADNLADLRRVNTWLGGLTLSARALDDLLASVPCEQPLTLLDVATGGGDIPLALARRLHHQGRTVRVVGSDINPQILHLAAEHSGTALRLAAADGCHLPLPDASVDAALCSLALHHLPPAGALALLRELRRVARIGLVVNDLLRTRHGYAGALLVGRLSANPLTRHDGPLSVRRAYTIVEMEQLATEAGLTIGRVHGFLGYRVAWSARSIL